MVEKQDSNALEILYESDHLIAINKPHGLLVHRSPIAKDATEFALQKVRRIVGKRVYLIHRLDRKTSGVLLFAKDPETNETLQSQFRERKVLKEYQAIVRGHISSEGIIDYALSHEDKTKAAVTHYQSLQHFEIPIASGGFPSSRYSLVKLIPKTGRHHQLRKHLAHINHPIIGDRPHGCNKQNKLWKEKFGMTKMLLHALNMSFEFQGKEINVQAPFSIEFSDTLQYLNTANIS